MNEKQLAKRTLDPIDGSTGDFMDALRRGETRTRVRAAWRLGQLGREAARCVPQLVERLGDPSTRVRIAASGALLRVASARESAPVTWLLATMIPAALIVLALL